MSQRPDTQDAFFGRYELSERIALGRTCDVFLATSHGVEGFRRTVVVKRLRPAIANAPDLLDRYLGQLRLHCSLSHANVIQALDLGEFDGQYFLTEEYVEGYDLATLRDTALQGDLMLTAPLGLFLVSEVVKAAEYGHRRLGPSSRHPQQLAHGDLHPRNILVGGQGEVKIADFGVWRHIEDHDTSTIEGQLRAYGYASPEVALGGAPTVRSDLFTLGLLTIEVCSGNHPYADRTADRVCDNARNGRIAPKLLETVPDPFRALVARMVEHDPAERTVDLGVLYDRVVSYLHAKHDAIGARALAEFVATVDDIEMSTSVVYSGMLASQLGTPASTSDPGLGALTPVKVKALWGEDDSGPPSGELLAFRLPEGKDELLEPNGREGPLRAILEAAERTRKGCHGAVFVSGPRGVGKSHVLRLAHRSLSEEGFRAVYVSPHRETAGHPYGMLADFLAVATTGRPLLWSRDPGGELIAALEAEGIGGPKTRQLVGQIVSLSRAASLSTVRRAMSQLVQGLAEASRTSLILLLDSAEHADLMTLELLHGALGSNRSVPLLLVLASGRRALLSQLARVTPEEVRTTLILPPLDSDAMVRLGNHVAEDTISDEALDTAAGLPQAIIDQALRQRYQRRPSKRVDRLDWLLLGMEPLPADIVTALAVADVPVTTLGLADALGAEAGLVHRTCRRLAGLHLVVETAADHWAIGLRSAGSAVHRTADPRDVLRWAKHFAKRAAKPGPGATFRRPTATRLFGLSGQSEKALEYGRAHAEALARTGFTDIALSYLDNLARITEQELAGSPSEALQLRLRQVELGVSAHRLAHVREMLARLVTNSRDLRDDNAVLQVLAQQLRVSVRSGDDEAASESAARLASATDRSASPTAFSWASLALAEWHHRQGRLSRADGLLRATIPRLPAGPGGIRLELNVRFELVTVLSRQGVYSPARQAATGPSGNVGRLLERYAKGITATCAGRWTDATGPLDQAYTVAHHTGHLDLCLKLGPQLVQGLIESDKLGDAEARLEELNVLATRLGAKPMATRTALLAHLLAAVRGQDGAIDALSEAAQAAADSGNPSDALEAAWLLYRAQVLSGDAQATSAPAAALARKIGDRRLG